MGLSATEARKVFSRALTRSLRQGRLPVRTRGAGTWEIGPKEGLVVSPEGKAALVQFKTRFLGWAKLHPNENPNNAEVGQGRMNCDFYIAGYGGGGQYLSVGGLPCPEVLRPLCDMEDSIVERIARKAGLEYVAAIQATAIRSRVFLILDAGVTRRWKHSSLIDYFYWESAEDLVAWGEALGQRFDGLVGGLAKYLRAEAEEVAANGGPKPPSAKELSDGTREEILKIKKASVARSQSLSGALEEMLESARQS